MGEIADQILRRLRLERFAQFEQTVAQAVTSLLGTLIRPEQIGHPLPTDRLPSLRRQIS